MRRVGILPAVVTLANGYCGLLSIFKTHDRDYYVAGVLIVVAMAFDVVDGMVARIAGASTSFGAYLDSLCDAISFGVAPAFLVKAVVEDSVAEGLFLFHPKLLALLTAVFTIGALIRLARYNVEQATGQSAERRPKGKGITVFSGLPAPGAAGVLAGLVIMAEDPKALSWYQHVVYVLPVLAFVLGFLMVSRVPYVHLGSRFLGGRRGFGYLFFIVVTLALIMMFSEECAAIGFLAYALSPLLTLFGGAGKDREHPPDGVGDDSGADKVQIPDGL